jgi:hypothetical protein
LKQIEKRKKGVLPPLPTAFTPASNKEKDIVKSEVRVKIPIVDTL